MELLDLKHTHFVLWRPRITVPAPRLIIGRFQPGNPPTLGSEQSFDLAPLPGQPDLWGIAANDCHLNSGEVYHYWFEVDDSRSTTLPKGRGSVTDPFGHSWAVATHVEDVPPEEMAERAKAAMAAMSGSDATSGG